MDDISDLQEKSVEELLEITQEGGEIVVESSEVAQKLEAHGFEIVNPNQDGSQFILRGKGENNAEYRTGDELALPHVVQVDMGIEEEEGDFRTGPVANSLPQPVRTLLKEIFISSPEMDPQFVLDVKDSKQEVFAAIEFKRAYTRPTDSCEEVQVHLMLKQATFGVENCIVSDDFLGCFVHQLDIVVSPNRAWKPFCTVADVRPGDNSVTVARGQSKELQVAFGTSGQVPGAQFAATFGTSTGISLESHGWLPARAPRPRPNREVVAEEDKSVTWTWKLSTWKDGQKFDANQTWFRTRNVPKLPFQNPKIITLIDLDLENDATWKVPKSTADALEHAFMWDVRVRVHVRLVRSWLRFRVLGEFVLARGKSVRGTTHEFASGDIVNNVNVSVTTSRLVQSSGTTARFSGNQSEGYIEEQLKLRQGVRILGKVAALAQQIRWSEDSDHV